MQQFQNWLFPMQLRSPENNPCDPLLWPVVPSLSQSMMEDETFPPNPPPSPRAAATVKRGGFALVFEDLVQGSYCTYIKIETWQQRYTDDDKPSIIPIKRGCVFCPGRDGFPPRFGLGRVVEMSAGGIFRVNCTARLSNGSSAPRTLQVLSVPTLRDVPRYHTTYLCFRISLYLSYTHTHTLT